MPINSPKCDERVEALPIHKCLTPAKGEPMPRTVEHYQANAIRDQELILEQRDEIGRLNTRLNKLEQKKQSPRQVMHPQHGVCKLGIYRNGRSGNLFYSECEYDTATNRVKPYRRWLDDPGLINVEMQELDNE